MPLPYTLDRITESENAVLERNIAVPDKFGGSTELDWQVYLTVRCRFWWWHSEGARSAAREYGEDERNVNLRGGGMLLPLGTEVTDEDRLGRILDPEGNPIVDTGPFRIVAVLQLASHLELSLYQP